jgi:ADP-ribose pyrophosphatase YjhB (NUDIX family)
MLTAFLDMLEPCVVEQVRWATADLEMATYLHSVFPPDEYVSSVRAIVLTTSGIALLHNPRESHILPGGRREAGETLLETLEREVAEETGCRIVETPVPIGFLHFRHMTPKPEGYRYPYPDFIQPIYGVRAEIAESRTLSDDDWEDSVEFVTVPRIRRETLPSSQVRLLEQALCALGAWR